MTRPISGYPPKRPCATAPHAVLLSLPPKTGLHALDISPSSEHTTPVTVTSHTRTVRHESELCQESRAPW
jgi:hypothetical protein